MPPVAQRFTAEPTPDRQGRTHVPVPFDPDGVWGPKLGEGRKQRPR